MNAVQEESHQPSTTGAGNAGAEGLTSEEARHRLNKFGLDAVPDTSVHLLQMILAARADARSCVHNILCQSNYYWRTA
jgi:hypothetical protein